MRLAFGLLLLLAAPASGEAPASLAWMEGAWSTEDAGSGVTIERWAPMEGGTMLGTSQTVREGTTRSFEFMRIAREDGSYVFYGSPGGAPAVPFRLVAADPARAVFENAAHDYPQRISYRREGDRLVAEVSDLSGGNRMRWDYRRR